MGAAEKAKENSYSAKSSISKAMGDDMSEYRKIIQQELDEEGDTETDAEMDAQLKVIAQLANEKTSSAKTYSAKALGDNKSTWSPPRYSDFSSAKYTGSYGLGHRGYSSANAVTKRPIPITFPTSDSVVLINGVPCSSSNVEIVANWCVPKSPHFDQEGDVCANDGTS